MSRTCHFYPGQNREEQNAWKPAKSSCTLCRYFQKSSPFGKGSGQRSATKDFTGLTNDGCGMCLVLRDAIVAVFPSAKDHLSNVYLTLSWSHAEMNKVSVMSPLKVTGIAGPFAGYTESDWEDLGLEETDLFEEDEHVRFELELHALKGGKCPWFAIGCSNPVPGDTTSDMSFKQALEWLQNCSEHHSCKRRPESHLPSRILEFSIDEASRAPYVKLVEGRSLSARYACLSHCWGSANILKTTTQTLEAHKSQIRWDTLPKTFKDAINYALRLGINYMWVDSLCIIQDDTDDWRKEGAQMASIYEGSYITIAATASADSEGGLTPLSDPTYRPLELYGSGPDGEYHIGVRKPIPHWYEDYEDFGYWSAFSDMSAEFPLLTRAWVFQERLLSPRVLHFGPRELLWECNEAVSCECSGVGFDTSRIQLKIDHKSVLEGASSSPDIILPKEWRNRVHEFTRLNLTFEKDIFPSLSGAVKQIQRIRPAEYVAGLWQDDIVEDLLWETYDTWAGRPATWRAPTWSWASIKGSVNYSFSLNMRAYCTPISLSASPAGIDRSGELKSAQLIIEGEVIAGTLRYYPDKVSAQRSAAQDPSLRSPALSNPALTLANFAVTHSKFPDYKWHFYADYDLSADGDGHLNSGDTVFFLRMAYKGYQQVFLVLRASPSATGAYERIGLGRYNKNIGNIYIGGASAEKGFSSDEIECWEGAQSVPLKQSDEEEELPFSRRILSTYEEGWFRGAERQVIVMV